VLSKNSRTDDWLKLKCKKRQEFVIAGYTDRSPSAYRQTKVMFFPS
jgi:ATP-dependent DNA ligase